MAKYNVVLMARIDDMAQLATVETRSTIVEVDADPVWSPAEIAEVALEIGPSVGDWTRT